MTFLERWANPQPSKPPVLPGAADSEPIEADSRGVNPAADSPELQQPAEEEVAIGVARAVDTNTPSLKGQAVELWRDGRRFFLVSDEQDAQEAMRRFGAHRGEVWTGAEIELVASIPDQAIRDEVESFKREMDGCFSPDASGEGVSPAEWKAQRLNELFRAQGTSGGPGKIRPETVQHGEGKTRGANEGPPGGYSSPSPLLAYSERGRLMRCVRSTAGSGPHTDRRWGLSLPRAL